VGAHAVATSSTTMRKRDFRRNVMANLSQYGSRIVNMLLMFFFLLSGISCAINLDEGPRQISLFTEDLEEIHPGTVIHLIEIQRLFDNSEDGAVSGIYIDIPNNFVKVVYSNSGKLKSYDLSTSKLVSSIDLGIKQGTSVEFNISGSQLLGATRSTIAENNLGVDVYVGGIALWDTSTGVVLKCYDPPCSDDNGTLASFAGFALNPNGDSIIIFSDYVFSINSGLDIPYTEIETVNSPDSGTLNTIGKMSYDHLGRRFAIAYENGEIEIGGFPRVYLQNEYNDRSKVDDLVFSNNGKLLATISNNIIIIWNVGLFQGNISFTVSIPGAKLIAFDALSKLLFISTDEQTIAIELESQNILSYIDTPGITSLVVSQDNKILVWGDKDGSVYVLASPINK
jgi:WD40 repeat protein